MDRSNMTDRDRMVRALSLAISQPTISGGDPAPFRRMHTLLRELFPAVFENAGLQTVSEGALLIHLRGERLARPLVFQSHLDVVDAFETANWRYPPFSGTVADGFVYGRGAADMKGHLIALLSAAEELLKTGWQPNGDIWFALSCDEEIRGGSMVQMARILDAQGVKPAFVLDEGGAVTKMMDFMRQPVAFVGVAEKGRLRFTLSLKGENAAERLAKAAVRISRIHTKPRLCAETQLTLQALSGSMEGVERFFASHMRLFSKPLLSVVGRSAAGRAVTRTQLSLRSFRGDAYLGQTPMLSYQATILPGDSAEKFLARVRRTVQDPDIVFTVQSIEEPSRSAPVKGTAWDALVTAIQIHFPHTNIAPCLLAGGTDARRMEGLTPCVYRFSPFILPLDELARIHSVNERISIDNLMRAESFFKQMLQA